MEKNFGGFSMQEAMRLAHSDAGQQLLAILQSTHADEMNAAMDSARSGDMDAVKQALATFMADPETKKLLQRLQEDRHE